MIRAISRAKTLWPVRHLWLTTSGRRPRAWSREAETQMRHCDIPRHAGLDTMQHYVLVPDTRTGCNRSRGRRFFLLDHGQAGQIGASGSAQRSSHAACVRGAHAESPQGTGTWRDRRWNSCLAVTTNRIRFGPLSMRYIGDLRHRVCR